MSNQQEGYSDENVESSGEKRPFYERQSLQHLEHYTKIPNGVQSLKPVQAKYGFNEVPDIVYGKTNEKQRMKIMHKLQPVTDLGLIIMDNENMTLADLMDSYLEPAILELKLNRSDNGYERKESNSTNLNQNVRTEEVRRRQGGIWHNPFKRRPQ